jgi:hypothetical protein
MILAWPKEAKCVESHRKGPEGEWKMAKSGGVFRCVSCAEFISVSAKECRFCGAAVNAEDAIDRARAQSELDNAIGGARTIRLMGPPLLILIPLTILLGLLYSLVLFVILEVMVVSWLFRFQEVQAPEVRRLRTQVWLFLLMGLVSFSVAFVLFVGLVLLRVRTSQ